MPMIRVRVGENMLPGDAKLSLASALTAAVLKWERAPDLRFFRENTWLIFDHFGLDTLYCGGASTVNANVLVEVSVPAGTLSLPRKAGLIEEITDHIRQLVHVGAQSTDCRVWVLVHDVDDGGWGMDGGGILRWRACAPGLPRTFRADLPLSRA